MDDGNNGATATGGDSRKHGESSGRGESGRLLWDQEVVSSNLAAPTFQPESQGLEVSGLAPTTTRSAEGRQGLPASAPFGTIDTGSRNGGATRTVPFGPLHRGSLVDRFWARVPETPNDAGCWIFEGRPSRNNGYGMVCVGHKGYVAHRLSWQIHNGPIPEGLCVCHHCDTPRCVNPDHLFLGTHTDNMRDKTLKGRGNPPIGSRCHLSKLSDSKVLEIRARCAAGEKQGDVGARFGVSQAAVSDIVRRRVWRHI